MDAQAHGYVETILGRRRPVTDINSGVLSVRNAAERTAINGVVQGSAADLFKIAMNRVYHRLKKDNRPSKMLLQVHDELVFETPTDAVEADAANHPGRNDRGDEAESAAEGGGWVGEELGGGEISPSRCKSRVQLLRLLTGFSPRQG